MFSVKPLYNSNRKTIKIIDRLKDVGLHKFIQLPRMVVCGDQSSGKSSLLEAIVGADFLPKGPGIQTRRPLELRLQQSPGLSQAEVVFDCQPNNKYTDFYAVEKKIVAETEKVAGCKAAIVDDPIKLTGEIMPYEVYLRETPDLTLIDLPGITRIPLRNSDQENVDIQQITTQLVAKYCRDDDRTIILCIIPANIDLSTSHALHLARIWDQKGQRTIGVLTKIDLMDEATDASEALSNKLIPLKLGYSAVKCRSQQDLKNGLSVAESLMEEQNYFRTHEKYRQMNPQLFGVINLTKKLSTLLQKAVRNSLPSISRQIEKSIHIEQQTLKSLGNALPSTPSERIASIYRLIVELSDKFKASIKGRNASSQSKSVKYSGGNIIKILFNELYEELSRRDHVALSDVDDQTIDRVIKMHQGDSIPGFPSIYAFMYLVNPLIAALHEPAEKCLSQIHTYLHVVATQITQKVFQRFPNIADFMSDAIDSFFELRKAETMEVIQGNIDSQLGYLMTNDQKYILERTKLIPPPSKDKQSIEEPDKKKPISAQERQKMRKQRLFVTEMRLRVEAYFRLVIRNLREIIPKNIGHLFCQMICENLELYLYHKISKKQDLIESLSEDKQVLMERKRAQQKLDTMKKASYFLKDCFIE